MGDFMTFIFIETFGKVFYEFLKIKAFKFKIDNIKSITCLPLINLRNVDQ